MAQLFIAYSRADLASVEGLVSLLRQALPEAEAWYDMTISGGADWWRRILYQIDASDLFIYLLSRESLESPYCQAEFREALRLRKVCLAVIIERQIDVTRTMPELAAELRRRPWVNMPADFGFPQANARLIAAIRKLLSEMPTEYQWPLSPVPVLAPELTETLKKKSRRRSRANQVAGYVGVTALVAVLGWLVISGLTTLLGQEAPVPTTSAALMATTEAPAAMTTPGATRMPATRTPAPPTSTATPTAIDVTRLVATIHARATDAQATASSPATAAGTRSALAQTATALAGTPSLDATAGLDATAAAEVIDTLPALEAALQRAASFSGNNADWTPSVYAFPDDPAGAELALVPVGRFMMGSENPLEGPVHEQTFAAPFWIERAEVTRAQYARCVAAGACTEPVANAFSQRDTQPVNRVTWFQARDYCAWRGMRLPTEAEWEYAARGPADWIYPWGDEWAEDRAAFFGNSGDETADVGRLPAGASWVGAFDLSGNVWEWTSSLSADYPYDATHESASDADQPRVMRGGAFDGGSDLLRAAYREQHSPAFESYALGLRCARP